MKVARQEPGFFTFRGAKYTTMTELGFKEWLAEQEQTDEGVLGRIGGAALAALKNMGVMTAKGGLNTLGGTANTALGLGQALIPGQRLAGAKRVGRGLLQAGKGAGQVALGGAPALAAAAGMPGADLAVGALAPHIGAAAAGLLPAAVQGMGSAVPAVTPALAAAQHLYQGKGPAAAPGSAEKGLGLKGWKGDEPPKPGFSNLMNALGKAKGSTPPPIPAAAARPVAAPAKPESAEDKMLKMKYALAKAAGKPVPYEVVPDEEVEQQAKDKQTYENALKRRAGGFPSPPGHLSWLYKMDQKAKALGWPPVQLMGSMVHIPGSMRDPSLPPLPKTAPAGPTAVTSPDMSSPDAGTVGASLAATSRAAAAAASPDASATAALPKPPSASGRSTKDLSDDEIKAEMERRMKGGDKATAEKLAHVLKRRAEKAVTPTEKAPDGMPTTPREKMEWEQYTKMISSSDPAEHKIARTLYPMLRAKYRSVKWPKPPGYADPSKTLPDPTSSAATPV